MAARSPRLAWLLADALRGYFWLSRLNVEWLDVATAALSLAQSASSPSRPQRRGGRVRRRRARAAGGAIRTPPVQRGVDPRDDGQCVGFDEPLVKAWQSSAKPAGPIGVARALEALAATTSINAELHRAEASKILAGLGIADAAAIM